MSLEENIFTTRLQPLRRMK